LIIKQFDHSPLKGLVIKNTGSWYTVRTDDGQLLDCKIKGNFRLKGIRSTNPVAVGDRVHIKVNAEGTAMKPELANDNPGVHPNADGYAIMESLLLPVIKKLR
jgi:translation initiation factor IF-1